MSDTTLAKTSEKKTWSSFFAKKRHFPFVIDVLRIGYISDAVIAIAITLLVVDITVPHHPKGMDEAKLDNFISDFLQKTIWYIGSYYFVVITLFGYWLKHLWIFIAVKEGDSTVSLFNTAFLLFISFTPFAFKIARLYLTQYYTWMIVFGSLTCTGLSLLFLWLYATFRRKWVQGEKHLPSETIHTLTLTLLFPILIHALCIGLAAANFIVPIVVACLVPLYYILAALRLDIIDFTYKAVSKCFKRKDADISYANEELAQLDLDHPEHHDENDEAHKGHDEYIDKDRRHPFWDKTHFHHEVLERMAMFSDGIFAIVITILVLEMRPPHMKDANGKEIKHELTLDSWGANGTVTSPWQGNYELGKGLAYIWPEYVSFLTSVVLVASFWKHHMACMQGLRKANKLVLLVNIMFMATIALIPFGSNFLSMYHDRTRSAVVYNSILLASAFFLLILYSICHFSHLAKPAQDLMKLRWRIYELFRTLVIIVVCGISLGVAFVDSYIAIGIALIIPLLEVLHAVEYLDVLAWIWRAGYWVFRKCGFEKVKKHDDNVHQLKTQLLQDESEHNV